MFGDVDGRYVLLFTAILLDQLESGFCFSRTGVGSSSFISSINRGPTIIGSVGPISTHSISHSPSAPSSSLSPLTTSNPSSTSTTSTTTTPPPLAVVTSVTNTEAPTDRSNEIISTDSMPVTARSQQIQNTLRKSALPMGVGLAAVAATAFSASAMAASSSSMRSGGGGGGLITSGSSLNIANAAGGVLGKDAYNIVGNGLNVCKILNGMWQVSGAHGFSPQRDSAVEAMTYFADEGFSTFDLADIYGPAEDYVGAFSKGKLASPLAKSCNFFTKWVPRPQEISKKEAEAAINKSLKRMNTDSLDLLQFHWWDYGNKYYYDAMGHLMYLQETGAIKNLGLTNFDTHHMVDLIEQGVPIVSNQVSYSILDTRPGQLMAPECIKNNVKLLCYGTLLGGFLSDEWLGEPEPRVDNQTGEYTNPKMSNVSLRKYLPWILYWGGWDLFQEMLTVLAKIGRKYEVSLSNVAVRWVLDQPAVGGAIIGVRLGFREHLRDNKRVFGFSLDEDDKAAIAAVQIKKRNDLMAVFGDCGAEYRRRPPPRRRG